MMECILRSILLMNASQTFRGLECGVIQIQRDALDRDGIIAARAGCTAILQPLRELKLNIHLQLTALSRDGQSVSRVLELRLGWL
jgi:hypothetical protein